ncbi:MAG: ribosomal protein [Rickettsiaceae bacterium]|jgi:small subunit ribosomal protein S7|nr:ribosomal protein [Rickettsiaceae bacterium]
MSRRHAAERREVTPDVKFGSVLVSKFINKIMEMGKKAQAEKIVYGALNRIESKHKLNGYEAFTNALSNVKPNLEVTSVRVGGANYQVPSVVDERRASTLAIRWIIDIARKRPERTMADKLAEELFEAANNRGAAIKKREDTHKMAEANKAFSHFSPKKTKGY